MLHKTQGAIYVKEHYVLEMFTEQMRMVIQEKGHIVE